MKRRILKPKTVELSLTPMEVVERLECLDGFIFFDSAGNFSSQCGKVFSILAARPEAVFSGCVTSPEVLRQAAADYVVEGPELDFPMGGLCGWVDYEGNSCFGLYSEMLVYDHGAEQWWEVGELSTFIDESEGCEGGFSDKVEIGEFRASSTRSDYLRNVQKAQRYIDAGDIYQVNITQRYTSKVRGGSLFGLYAALRLSAPAPLAAWIKLGGLEVLSSSPETFLKMKGREVETRPIKGTRPRFESEDEDDASARELQASEKEVAELVMITDLERNDLGQICEFGSVEVPNMIQLEKLEHVYHLVSRVKGILREDVDHWSALAECFPGGSITGAPKKRAMEVIKELEIEKRGLYTGVVGYVGFNGCSQFNIVIRTLLREGDELSYNVGAGIVADSDAEAEYDETLHKARGIRQAVREYQEGLDVGVRSS